MAVIFTLERAESNSSIILIKINIIEDSIYRKYLNRFIINNFLHSWQLDSRQIE